jgi:hypothetical protein
LRLAPDLDSASLPLIEAPVRLRRARGETHNAALDAMIARHAAANGVPESLVRHVVMRESRYNPRASHAGNFGLMQIRHQTARGLGYTGSTAGLLDPETNLTYAVRYLAGAYRLAGGNSTRAYSYYRTGYYRRGDSARVVRTSAEESVLPVKHVVVKEIHLGRPDDAATSASASKAITVREAAVKDVPIKDQSRVVNTPLVRAATEREPPLLRASTEREPPLRTAAVREPHAHVRHARNVRHGRRVREADGGILDSLLKIAARGSIKPKRHAPLARAD